MEIMTSTEFCTHINNYCRTCLNPIAADISYNLSNKLNDAESLKDLLMSCTTIQVATEDLSSNICESCCKSLIAFNNFKKIAEHIDSRLNSYLQQEIYSSNDIDTMIINIKNECEKLVNETDNYDNVKTEIEERNFNMYDEASEESQGASNEYSTISENFSDSEQFENCSNKDKIGTNVKKKPNQNLFICDICNEKFSHHYKLVQHIVHHGGNIVTQSINTFECEVCSKCFKSINSLCAHKRKHVPKGRIISCTVCEKQFKKISHLKRHEILHENNRPYKCGVCLKSFAEERVLKEHMNEHNGIKPYECLICDKTFSQISVLTNHIKFHLNDKKESANLCPICGKHFASASNLNHHVNRHTKIRVFVCELCSKEFASKAELKMHNTTHTGEKLYNCDDCGAKFTNRSNLGRHKAGHLGIRPYECNACSMRFLSKDHLKRHIRIHSGERPYRCEVCDRLFSQNSDLVRHRRLHLRDNVHKCSHCTQSFRLKSDLLKHISDHFLTPHLQNNADENTNLSECVGSRENFVIVDDVVK